MESKGNKAAGKSASPLKVGDNSFICYCIMQTGGT